MLLPAEAERDGHEPAGLVLQEHVVEAAREINRGAAAGAELEPETAVHAELRLGDGARVVLRREDSVAVAPPPGIAHDRRGAIRSIHFAVHDRRARTSHHV